MTYRSDVDALAARHAALETEVADRSRELARAKDLLEDARARSRLPVLENIRVASPCPASWEAMTGDARVRACGDCKKNVYNLSEMTRDEAEALIKDKEGRLCIRYFQRKDGTILLKDCVIGVRKARRRRLVALGMAVGAAASAITYTTVTRATHATPDHEMGATAFMGGSASNVEPAHVVPGERASELHEVKGDYAAPARPQSVKPNVGKLAPQR